MFASGAAKVRIGDVEDDVEETTKASITLADCLACSGCITSAESVLIEQQSPQRLQEMLKGDEKVVVSIQLQPVVSLSEKFGIGSINETFKRLSGFFKSKGVEQVFDLRLAEDVSLLEHRKEFVSRFRSADFKRPLLTSSCPGWICYAEKTHGHWILPHVSRVRSAQQIMGAFIKEKFPLCKHVTVMPCFDKKLEASRGDFGDDVDLVITTVEIERMIADEIKPDLKCFKPVELDGDFDLKRNRGSGSGGYAENVFIHAAKELFGNDLANDEIVYEAVKNNDFLVTTLKDESGKTLLKFGVANGFKNIQNVVQKMKRKRCDFDFIEIMACPSGCLNGGAQARPANGNAKELISILEANFKDLEVQSPENNPKLKAFYNDWLGGEDTDKAAKLLYTEYHEIEKDLSSNLAIKW